MKALLRRLFGTKKWSRCANCWERLDAVHRDVPAGTRRCPDCGAPMVWLDPEWPS